MSEGRLAAALDEIVEYNLKLTALEIGCQECHLTVYRASQSIKKRQREARQLWALAQQLPLFHGAAKVPPSYKPIPKEFTRAALRHDRPAGDVANRTAPAVESQVVSPDEKLLADSEGTKLGNDQSGQVNGACRGSEAPLNEPKVVTEERAN